MFKFLKEKLKAGISLFSKKIDESGDTQEESKEEIHDIVDNSSSEEISKTKKTYQSKDPVSNIEVDSTKVEHVMKKEIKIESPKVEEKSPFDDIEDSIEESPASVEFTESTIESKPESQENRELLKTSEETVDETLRTTPKEKKTTELTQEEIDKNTQGEPLQHSLPENKQGFFSKIFKKKEKEEIDEFIGDNQKKPDKQQEDQNKEAIVKKDQKDEPTLAPEQIKPMGVFEKLKEKVVTKKINEKKFEDLFWDLEVSLLENNVAVEVIEKLKDDLKKNVVDTPIRRNKIEETIATSLKKSIDDILSVPKINLLQFDKKPLVICFVGVNGSGKTTSVAKIAKLFLDKGKKVCLAAADTFRAAAIDQLQIHANNLGVKMIKHDYGSDPAAVAFDAIKYAKIKKLDAVLIDTAGRLHSNTNLIDEMKKIIRVANPDVKLFVGEAITGNDCVEQAKKFDEAIDLDGIILSKADIDEKGGTSLSIGFITKKPILYIGTGQEYSDLKPFNKEEIMANLGLT